MSLFDMGSQGKASEVSYLETFKETAIEIDDIVFRHGGEFLSRQAFAVVIVLLRRIEQLEKRLDANGIYQ